MSQRKPIKTIINKLTHLKNDCNYFKLQCSVIYGALHPFWRRCEHIWWCTRVALITKMGIMTRLMIGIDETKANKVPSNSTLARFCRINVSSLLSGCAWLSEAKSRYCNANTQALNINTMTGLNKFKIDKYEYKQRNSKGEYEEAAKPHRAEDWEWSI